MAILGKQRSARFPGFCFGTLLIFATFLAVVLVTLAVGDEPDSTTIGRPLALTADQREWLEAHPTLRVGMDPHWAPFSFYNERGELVGYDVDLLALIEASLGVSFEVVKAENWEALLALAKQGQVDILLSTAETPERREFLAYTEPYLGYPSAIITRGGGPFLVAIEQFRGRRIAVAKDYVYHETFMREYPWIDFVTTPSNVEALVLLSRKEVDATVANLANASHIIRAKGLTNLKISGITPHHFELRAGVRKDWPQLAAIFEAALLNVDADTKARLLGRWIYVEHSDLIVWSRLKPYVVGGLGVFIVLLAALAGWNHLLSRDVQRRRKAEQALKEVYAHLHKVNAEKSQVINMVAHDIRGPLTNMMLRLDLLCSRPATSADELRGNLLKARDELRSQAKRVNDLLEQMITVNALEAGEYEPQLKWVKLNPLICEVLASYEVSARVKSIQIISTNLENGLSVRTDSQALFRVIDNLVSNAVKYTPFGGRIGVETTLKRDWVLLRVWDTGPGLTSADRTRLYQKFATLSARPTHGESSIGLGLAITKSLVTLINGRICCESTPGAGAAFIVEIPVGSRVEPRAAKAEAAALG